LQSIAYDEYRDPQLWRGIAATNNIDDPLRLRAGTSLLLPPADEAAELS
jgi:nucleoid-associated protein YgaU